MVEGEGEGRGFITEFPKQNWLVHMFLKLGRGGGEGYDSCPKESKLGIVHI